MGEKGPWPSTLEYDGKHYVAAIMNPRVQQAQE